METPKVPAGATKGPEGLTSLLRGLFISVGGGVFMFCCLAILTISSCTFGS
jgi:hypothetical protein